MRSVESSVVLVLESEHHPKARNFKSLADWLAVGLKNKKLPISLQEIDPSFDLNISLMNHQTPKLEMHWSA